MLTVNCSSQSKITVINKKFFTLIDKHRITKYASLCYDKMHHVFVSSLQFFNEQPKKEILPRYLHCYNMHY